MKKWLPISILLLFQTGSYGQTNKGNGQLDISIGPSFPVGQFASKNIYSEKAGLASAGGIVNVSYLIPAMKKIGLAISLHGQLNPIARRSIEKSFSQLPFASFAVWTGPGIPPNPPPQPTTTYPNWKFKTASWKLGALMTGGYTDFKIKSAKLIVTSKAMIGLAYAVSPKVDGSSITDTSIVHVTQSAESAFGFSYLLGGGLKIKVNNKLNFITGIEYFGTNRMTFKGIIARVTIIKHPNDPGTMSVSQAQVTANGKQVISTINFFAGIALKL